MPEHLRVDRAGPSIRAALAAASPDELPDFEDSWGEHELVVESHFSDQLVECHGGLISGLVDGEPVPEVLDLVE